MHRLRAWLRHLSSTDRALFVLGALLLAMMVLSSTAASDATTRETRALDLAALGLAIAAFAVLLLRKRFPTTVVLAALALAGIWHGTGYTNGIINVPVMVSCYHLGTTGDRRRQVAVGGIIVSFATVSIVGLSGAPPADAADAIGWPIVAIVAGEIFRVRRAEVEREVDMYAARAAAAEADRDAEAERRVTAERLRIARDVHDVLAHTVSVMTVQAGVAADVLDRDPATARASLATIRSAGQEAMSEVRATISVLRGGDPEGGDGTAPAPGLDRLPELVEAARTGGLDVELTVDMDLDRPDGRGVETLVELTAYRIVQEALTNVARHAAATRAWVHVEQRPFELVVEVRDDGPAVGAEQGDAPGFGLRGMRERVEPLGGALAAGPHPDGGWRVRATLPLRRIPSPDASRSASP